MKTNNVLQHPLILQFESMDLKKGKLSWELHDYIVSIVERCDLAYFKGVDDYHDLELLIRRLSPFLEECRVLEKAFPRNPNISHNREILLVVMTSLYMNEMSRPSREAS